MFFAILRIELFKIFKRPRTFISFGAIAIIVLLVQLALKVNGKDFIELYTDSQSDTFYIPYDKMVNGYFVCVAVLHMILIHVPLLIALIAGDMISGEANLGTLRLLGSKPVTRTCPGWRIPHGFALDEPRSIPLAPIGSATGSGR